MRVCFLVVGLHTWGKMSGSGSATRRLAIELAKRGIEICAVTPQRSGQKRIEYLEDIKVVGFSKYSLHDQMKALRACEADIYHSQDPSIGTWLAMKIAPGKKHVVTCLDIRSMKDWLILLKSDLADRHLRAFGAYLYENTLFASRGVREADAVFCPAKYILPLAQRRFKLERPPEFVSYPIEIPRIRSHKFPRPTVLFAGRWIEVKRPELFFQLANHFPDVHFIAMGRAENDRRDAALRQKYGSLPNLSMTGWLDQFRTSYFQEIFSKSWILINTDLRGGLPVTFVEAASFKCAILSSVNPDGFASKFGYWSRADDFVQGLRFLLRNDEWLKRGEKAYEYVRKFNDIDIVVDKHIKTYRELLDGNNH